jgi:hypothetical protein
MDEFINAISINSRTKRAVRFVIYEGSLCLLVEYSKIYNYMRCCSGGSLLSFFMVDCGRPMDSLKEITR